VKALVTRPREDAAPLAAELARRGIAPVIEPLLTIRFLPGALDLAGVQAVLFTSANGVRAFAAASARRDLPALAVGERSADEARRLGFGAAESAGGDVDDLAALAVRRFDPAKGTLLHPAASVVAGDLAGRLERAGFAVRRAVVYEAAPVRALTPAVARALVRGELDLALFFSPRTAASFVSLATAEAPGAAAAMTALCLSPAVADAARPLGWRSMRVAAAPTQQELLAALDVVIAGSHTTEAAPAGTEG
jgi:uroporphyrinogen-III synthase